MKALITILILLLSFLAFGQDKRGIGYDLEGFDSTGIGTTTTWVKPSNCAYGNLADYTNATIRYQFYSPDCDTTLTISDLATAKSSLDYHRNNCFDWDYPGYTLICYDGFTVGDNILLTTTRAPIVPVCTLAGTYWGVIGDNYSVGVPAITHIESGVITYIEYY